MRSRQEHRARQAWLGMAAWLAFGFGASAATSPSGERTLSLAEAVAIALENNTALSLARVDEQIAESRRERARAEARPLLAIEEAATRSTDPVFVFGALLSEESFGPENFEIRALNEPEAITDFRTSVNLSVPLWTGGRVSASVDAGTGALEAAASEVEATQRRVIHQVVEAYTRAVLALHQLDVAREAHETALAHHAMVKDLKEGGLVVASDLLQIEVRVREAEQAVVRAESAVAISHASMQRLLGDALGGARVERSTFDIAVETSDLESAIRRAKVARPEIKASTHRRSAADARYKGVRALRYPEVGLGASYQASARDYPGLDGSSWTVGVKAVWKLYDSGRTAHAVEIADRERRRMQLMLEDVERRIEFEVREAYERVRSAKMRLESAKGSTALAEESLRTIEDRYREGLETVVALLQGETMLTRTRLSEIEARREVMVAGSAWRLATGEPLTATEGRP